MKKWINISKELPPLGKQVKLKIDDFIQYGILIKMPNNRLLWDISGNLITDPHYSYYEIYYDDKGIDFWEKEIFEPIKSRFEILDL